MTPTVKISWLKTTSSHQIKLNFFIFITDIKYLIIIMSTFYEVFLIKFYATSQIEF